jgi:hypothetical protein
LAARYPISLDRLLEFDQSIGQTRFHWLRSAPEAPGASNLVGLTERIAFLRTLEIDPKLQMRISSGRWDQMIREGNATPAWLACDFNSSRRHALIVAQVIKLGQKLTDDAVGMFVKLMGRLFSQANNRKKQRHMDCRPDTAKALRMCLDTITALQSANDYGRNASQGAICGYDACVRGNISESVIKCVLHGSLSEIRSIFRTAVASVRNL